MIDPLHLIVARAIDLHLLIDGLAIDLLRHIVLGTTVAPLVRVEDKALSARARLPVITVPKSDTTAPNIGIEKQLIARHASSLPMTAISIQTLLLIFAV